MTLNFISDALHEFRDCFSRKAALGRFAVFAAGAVAASDSGGSASIIRGLNIDPLYYCSLAGFFRSSACDLWNAGIRRLKMPHESHLAYKAGGRFILLGDGARQGKEGGKTPGAEAARRDSGDSSKPGFIRGHMFGCMGLAAGSSLKLFSAPIIIELHAKISGMIRKFPAGSNPLGIHNIDRCYEAAAAVADEFIHNNNDNGSEGKKGGKGGKSDKHSVEKKKADKDDKGGESARIARMAADAGILAASMGIGCFLALDRHFMSETAFLISERAFGGAAGAAARAKLGSAACEPAPGRAGKPGGPGMKGAKIKLAGLFSHPESFKSAEAFIYGVNETTHYHEKNLLRGKNLAALKFVPAAGAGGRKTALASNNLQPGAKQMMELYGMRLKIEAALDFLKNLPQGFSRRFWSESTPKMRGLDYKGVQAALDEKAKSGIFKPLRAIEAFLAFSGAALGLVQMASAEYSSNCKNYLYRHAGTPNSSEFATQSP